MSKIYDVLLNFNKYPYEFYEWEKNDKIYHFKYIAVYSVSNDLLKDFINNHVIVDTDFLEKIKGTSKIYGDNKINNCVILHDDKRAIAFLFNEKGMLKKRSMMLFDEELDALKCSDEINIKYNIIKKLYYDEALTRNEFLLINKLIRYIKKINDKDEIKYLYFECFDEVVNNVVKAKKNMMKKIKNNNKKIIDKLNIIINELNKKIV